MAGEDEEFKDLDKESGKSPEKPRPSNNNRFRGKPGFKGKNQKGNQKGGNKGYQRPEDEGFVRVRMPRDGQSLGIVEQRLGGSRMRVRCFDGKTRVCRIPGRLKRKLWIREGDTILVEPWDISGDERGDVIFKYRPNQVKILEKKGMLEGIKDEDEF